MAESIHGKAHRLHMQRLAAARLLAESARRLTARASAWLAYHEGETHIDINQCLATQLEHLSYDEKRALAQQLASSVPAIPTEEH